MLVLGPLGVRNRLIMAPMGSCMADENGGVSPWQIDYYAERAKGGVGTIIVEITGIKRSSPLSRRPSPPPPSPSSC